MLLIYDNNCFHSDYVRNYFNNSLCAIAHKDNKRYYHQSEIQKNKTYEVKNIKKFTKESLEKYSKVEELFQYKSQGYYDTLKFEKCLEQNKDIYMINFQITQENKKMYTRIYIYYPYKKEINFIEIHELYYDNKLYKCITFDPKKVNHSTIYKIMKDFENDANFSYKAEKYQFDIQYEDKIYTHIKNNKSYNLVKYRYLSNKPVSFKNIYDLQKYDLEITQNNYKITKIDDNHIMKYYKKTQHPLVDYEYYDKIIIDKYSMYYEYDYSCDITCKYIVLSNATIIEYSGETGCFKRFINFFRRGKKRSISQVNNQNNEEEVIIDGETNKMIKVSIKGAEKKLDGIIGYKIAKINYKGKYEECIIEAKIPKDARIASDGSGKYRCDKLIPLEVYISVEGGIKKLNKDELKGVYCESSVHSSGFKYYIDQICEESNFDTDLNKVCTRGLHYCLSIGNAVSIFGGQTFNKNKLNILEE